MGVKMQDVSLEIAGDRGCDASSRVRTMQGCLLLYLEGTLLDLL